MAYSKYQTQTQDPKKWDPRNTDPQKMGALKNQDLFLNQF